MSWFDEQIRQRKESDQEVFEDSILRMASIVLGKRNAGILEDKRIRHVDSFIREHPEALRIASEAQKMIANHNPKRP